MILPFSTQINGKPTYFPQKIWKGLKEQDLSFYIAKLDSCYLAPLWKQSDIKPKLHTIREDKNDRWKKGNNIDFFINCRKPNMFRFAPVLPVVSIQTVYMSYAYNDIIEISINGRQLHNKEDILKFALNDGFDSWKDFFDYFYPIIVKTEDNWFVGKIIHWTDLRY